MTAFNIIFDGQQVVGTVATSAAGTGTALFDPVAVTLEYNMTITGLDFGTVLGLTPSTASTTDDVTTAHFHIGDAGVSGGVAFAYLADDDLTSTLNTDGTWTLSGLWEQTDSGSIADYADSFGGAVQGTDTGLYVNVHSTQFGGGEIRGQILGGTETNGPALLPMLTKVNTLPDVEAPLPSGPVANNIAVIDGTTYVYETGGTDFGGVSVEVVGFLTGYRIEADGTKTQLAERTFLQSPADPVVVELNGVHQIFTVNTYGIDPIKSFTIASDGSFEESGNEFSFFEVSGLIPFEIDGASYVLGTLFGEKAEYHGRPFELYSVASDGALSTVEITGHVGFVQASTATVIDGKIYYLGIFSESIFSEDRSAAVYSMTTGGEVSQVGTIDPEISALLVSENSQIKHVQIAENAYILVTTTSTGMVSAFEMTTDGLVDATARLDLIDLKLALEADESIDSFMVDGRPYITTPDGTVEIGTQTVNLVSSSDTGVSDTDNDTSDATPTIRFVAPTGVSVAINWDDGRGFVDVDAGTGAAQNATLDVAYTSDGEKTIQVRTTDAANNTATSALDIRLGTTVPSFTTTPSLAASSDTGTAGDNISADVTPTVSVAIDTGATVEINWDDGRGFVSAGTANGSLQQFTLDTAYTTDGTKTIEVRSQNGAGDPAIESLAYTLDTTAPLWQTVLSNTGNLSLGTPSTSRTDAPIAVATVDGNTFVFAAGAGESGLSVLAMDQNGALTQAGTVPNSGPLKLNGITSLDVETIGETTFLFANGRNNNGISVFSVGSDGSLTNTDNVSDTLALEMAGARALTVATVGSNTYLYVGAYSVYDGTDVISDSISIFSVAADGKLTFVGNGGFPDNQSLEVIKNGGTSYLVQSGSYLDEFVYDKGIVVAPINADGTLGETQSVSHDFRGPLQIRGSIAADGIVIDDTTFLYGIGEFSRGFSGFSFTQEGGFTNVENVSSTDGLFASSDLTTTMVGDIPYLFTASGGGVSAFTIGPDGTVTNVANIDNSENALLEAAGTVETATVDGREYLFVAPEYGGKGVAAYHISADVDLLAASDTGSSNSDNFTRDLTPTISFSFEDGVMIDIDWDDGAGFIAAGTSDGTLQEATLATAYAEVGDKTITVRATDAAGNTTLRTLDIGITPPSILGTETAENVDGTSGSDYIEGLGGGDWITPGAGSDTIDGGDGRDMVSFFNLADTPGRTNTQYRLDLDLTAGTATTSGDDVYTINNAERVTGTIFADRIKGDAGDNELRGLGDYDWFTATTGADTIDGGTGQDMISYVDWLNTADNTADPFNDGGAPPPNNEVTGVVVDLNDTSNNTNLAAGHTYIDVERVTGSGRQDVFYGDDSENDFRGLGDYDWFVSSTGGRERYFGGDGIDTVTYYNASAGVVAGLSNGARVAGEETGRGVSGDAALDLFFSIEGLVGTNYADTLSGSAGRNNLSGLDGDDFIYGYAGIDVMKGGLGDDSIDGGAGSDYALYDGNKADFTLTKTSTNEVTISGAEGTDSLVDVEYFRFADGDVTIWELTV